VIVKGTLSAIGSGEQNPYTGLRFINHIEFYNRDDFVVNQNHRIGMTQYIYDKLSRSLGSEVELSFTTNKKLLLAIRAGGKVFRVEYPCSSALRSCLRGFFIDFAMRTASWLLLFFIPGYFVFFYIRHRESKELKRAAFAFDQ
jgi:hypothetical protein